MTRREAILAMKVRIKEWSAFQKELKQIGRISAKAFPTPEQKAALPGMTSAFKKKHGISSEFWSISDEIFRGKARITAALNLYHELRGSSHCHGVSQPAQWRYPTCLSQLREEFAYEEVATVA